MRKVFLLFVLCLLAVCSCKPRKGKGAATVAEPLDDDIVTVVGEEDGEPIRDSKVSRRARPSPHGRRKVTWDKLKSGLWTLGYLAMTAGMAALAWKGVKAYFRIDELPGVDEAEYRRRNKAKEMREKA